MRGGVWKNFRGVSSLDQGGHDTPALQVAQRPNGRVVNKVRVERANPCFNFPKYLSSDALPAPEIFFVATRLG